MRRRLVVLAVLALAAALIPVTGLFYLVLSRSLEADARSVLRDRAAAASETVAVVLTHPRPTAEPTGEAVLDDTTWIYDAAGRPVETPATSTAADTAALSLAHVTREVRLDAAGLALLAVPVRDARGRRIGTVVAAVSRQPFERAEQTALSAALALDLVVLTGGAFLTWRTVSAALAPVARMTASAARWSAHDIHHRFALGPPVDELTGLAATLDGLLDRLATSLGHERRLTAEIAHELRTPLARLRADAEVTLRARAPLTSDAARGVLENVVTDVDQLSRTIDTLLHTAHSRPGPDTAGVRSDLLPAVRTALDRIGLHGVHPIVHGTGPWTVAAEPDLVVRVLLPVLENAATYGRGHIAVSVSTDPTDTTETESAGGDHGQFVAVEVTDDGDGFTVLDCDTVLEPGVRGSAATGHDGAGLGLPLSARLAASLGGRITALPATPDQPGGRIRLLLPRVTTPVADTELPVAQPV